jgi:hypothetical protein
VFRSEEKVASISTCFFCHLPSACTKGPICNGERGYDWGELKVASLKVSFGGWFIPSWSCLPCIVNHDIPEVSRLHFQMSCIFFFNSLLLQSFISAFGIVGSGHPSNTGKGDWRINVLSKDCHVLSWQYRAWWHMKTSRANTRNFVSVKVSRIFPSVIILVLRSCSQFVTRVSLCVADYVVCFNTPGSCFSAGSLRRVADPHNLV